MSNNFDARAVGTFNGPLLRRGAKVMTAGSCFAANLIPYLEKSGFCHVKTEDRHPDFRWTGDENFSYDKFSAGYGNIYTARQLLQLMRRCVGKFSPVEDRWKVDGRVIDPFRPGLRFFSRSDREFDVLTRQHLERTLAAFRTCETMIFTLGLTEAWRSKLDGAVFPACPGTIAGEFDSQKHEFVNFGVDEVVQDVSEFVSELREVNPDARLILTVSPVPLVATAARQHVLAATTYSKSVLRVAAEIACRENEGVSYFPAYEIVTGPQASGTFFEADLRNVSTEAVDTVMSAFLANCEVGEPVSAPEGPAAGLHETGIAALSARLSALECEEAAQGA